MAPSTKPRGLYDASIDGLGKASGVPGVSAAGETAVREVSDSPD